MGESESGKGLFTYNGNQRKQDTNELNVIYVQYDLFSLKIIINVTKYLYLMVVFYTDREH